MTRLQIIAHCEKRGNSFEEKSHYSRMARLAYQRIGALLENVTDSGYASEVLWQNALDTAVALDEIWPDYSTEMLLGAVHTHCQKINQSVPTL